MKIMWKPSTMDGPVYPDDCADCGEFIFGTKYINSGTARCYACHVSHKKK